MSEKENDGAGIILSKAFRKLLYLLNIDINRYQHLILIMIRKLMINSNYKIFSFTASLSDEIFGTSITWRTFIKSMIFLGASRLTIMLNPKEDGTMSEYTISLDDKELMNSLFTFVDGFVPEDDTGKHLRSFIDVIINDNGLEKDYIKVIENYVTKSKSTELPVSKSFKGNLIKELKSDKITWKVFVKILVVYGITEPVVGVSIYDKKDREYNVNFKVSLESIAIQ